MTWFRKNKETEYQKIKRRIYEVLEKAKKGDTRSHYFDNFLMVLIVLNVLAVIFETVVGLPYYFYVFFYVFEIFSVAIFTLEYLFRIWACTSDERYRHPIFGRLRFIISPMGVIDFLAITPFYFPYIIPFDLRELRALRLFKFFRLFKFGRYLESLNTLTSVIKRKREELILTVCLLSVLLVISASIMYYAENGAQPEKFSSIPASMWWGIVTLATIGYGDVYPITSLGRFLTAIIAMAGVGLFALPVAILGSGFMEEVESKRIIKNGICPHCGRKIFAKRGMFGRLRE